MTLTQQERGQLGARMMRERAIERYYKDPSFCHYCGSIIHVEEGRGVADIRRKKFCSHVCAGLSRGRGADRSISQCERCGKKIVLKKHKTRNSYHHRKYCEECVNKVRSAAAAKQKRKQDLPERTLGEMKQRRKEWSWRIAITNHARRVYTAAQGPEYCMRCGYSTFYDVCHIKDVASFSDDTKIKVINDLRNLIALCPNHHREFDKGLLKLSDINTEGRYT